MDLWNNDLFIGSGISLLVSATYLFFSGLNPSIVFAIAGTVLLAIGIVKEVK